MIGLWTTVGGTIRLADGTGPRKIVVCFMRLRHTFWGVVEPAHINAMYTLHLQAYMYLRRIERKGTEFQLMMRAVCGVKPNGATRITDSEFALFLRASEIWHHRWQIG